VFFGLIPIGTGQASSLIIDYLFESASSAEGGLAMTVFLIDSSAALRFARNDLAPNYSSSLIGAGQAMTEEILNNEF